MKQNSDALLTLSVLALCTDDSSQCFAEYNRVMSLANFLSTRDFATLAEIRSLRQMATKFKAKYQESLRASKAKDSSDLTLHKAQVDICADMDKLITTLDDELHLHGLN